MTKLYTLFCILFLCPAALFSEPPYLMMASRSVLPIRIIDKLVLVEASVDGRQGYFLLDTGIGALTLNDRFFGESGDKLSKFRKVTDVNGSRARIEGCHVGAFRWGALRRDSFYAPLVDLSGVEQVLDCELLGLIGWEVFLDVEILVDFDGQTLTLQRLNGVGRPDDKVCATAPDHILPFGLEGHLPVVSARIGERSLRLGFDSGASINLLDRRLRRDLPEDARRLFRIPYGGVFSDNRAPFIAVDAIYVDEQFALTGWRMAATPMKHFERKGMLIDGLIGADLFRLGRVAINYRHNEISLWVNKNIFSQRYQSIRGAGLAKQPAAAAQK